MLASLSGICLAARCRGLCLFSNRKQIQVDEEKLKIWLQNMSVYVEGWEGALGVTVQPRDMKTNPAFSRNT